MCGWVSISFCLPLSDVLSGDDELEFVYCLNDGVFGSFAYKLLEESVPVPSLLKVKHFQL